MPWTASTFASRHNRKLKGRAAEAAARQATALVRKGMDEGEAIRIANKTGDRAMTKKGWTPKAQFRPGGHKGKLHRELGIPDAQKIPKARLSSASRSSNPEIRGDAIRAETMSHWDHRYRNRSR